MTTPPDFTSLQPSLSNAGLAKATALALLIAIVLLVLVVFPAEYDIDPTGFGEAIGLTRLASVDGGATSEGVGMDTREDRVVVEVPAGSGVEYKFFLRAGQRMKYSWKDPERTLRYDFHGEPEGDTTGFFESYSKSRSSFAEGTFTAPFDGVHGWYWKNTSRHPAKITLMTSGSYEVLGLR